MTEVTYKQLAKWTKRCNGIAIWDTDNADSYMGICNGENKTCKDAYQNDDIRDANSCIGHYGVPYPNRCPICKSSKNLEICGLENSRAWELESSGDELHNVYICCNENGCNTILVNYMIEGQLNDYSDVIPDYKDMTKQLFGMEESK